MLFLQSAQFTKAFLVLRIRTKKTFSRHLYSSLYRFCFPPKLSILWELNKLCSLWPSSASLLLFPSQRGCPLSLFSPQASHKYPISQWQSWIYTTGNETKTCGNGPIGKGNLCALHFDGIDTEKKFPVTTALDFYLHFREQRVLNTQQTLKSWDLLLKSQRCLRKQISALHLLRHTPLHTKGCENLYLCLRLPLSFPTWIGLNIWSDGAALHPQRMGLWWIDVLARARASPRGVFSQSHGPSHGERPHTRFNDLLSSSWNS